MQAAVAWCAAAQVVNNNSNNNNPNSPSYMSTSSSNSISSNSFNNNNNGSIQYGQIAQHTHYTATATGLSNNIAQGGAIAQSPIQGSSVVIDEQYGGSQNNDYNVYLIPVIKY